MADSFLVNRLKKGSFMKFPREQDVTEYGGILEFDVYKTVPPKVTEMEGVGEMLGQFGIDIKNGFVEKVKSFDGAGAGVVGVPMGRRMFSVPLNFDPIKAAQNEKAQIEETRRNIANAENAYRNSDQQGPSQAPMADRTVRDRTEGRVQLYMPQGIQLTDGLEYDKNVAFGIFGSLVERGIATGDNIMSSIFKGIGEAFTTLKDATFGGASEEVVSLALARLSELPGIDQAVPGAAIRTALQKTPNPNIRAVFKQVNLRELQLLFKMKPTSQEEAEEIKRIIHFFRRNAYPESMRIKGISAGYNFPRKFSIRMLYDDPNTGRRRDVGFKMKKLHLTGVLTTFNPNNMAFYTDGNFEETDLQLTFIEEATLDRQDVEHGF